MYYVPYERVSHFLAIAKKFNIFHYDMVILHRPEQQMT